MPAEPRMRSRASREKYVTEHVARRMARQTDRTWTRNDIAQVLVDALIESGFDWTHPAALEEVKRLLVEAYRIAWQTIPAERLRFSDASAAAAHSRLKGISL